MRPPQAADSDGTAGAEALAADPGLVAQLGGAGLSAGGCFARPLPADVTCAAAARSYFREATSALGLPSGLLHDGVTMASELAANTLHAQRGGALAASPEIWLYLRGAGRGRELVCKVFDAERGWSAGAAPGLTGAPEDSVSGRGLQVVAGLSAGQWGCHLSRSRLGSWRVPGKAVWFCVRIPPAALPGQPGRPRYSPDWLTDVLAAMLADRGIADGLLRADARGTTVLSLGRHLTVWRLGDRVSWRSAAGTYQQLELADVVDVAEQVVCAYEEALLDGPAGSRDVAAGGGAAGPDSPAGRRGAGESPVSGRGTPAAGG